MTDHSILEGKEQMSEQAPVTTLQPEYSSANATPTAWAEARSQLETAEVFWLSTVRPDGRPHVTPLIAVWIDDALHFCTGVGERKAKNLAHNTHCVLTTGCNSLHEGLDVVVEGNAVQIADAAKLRRVAAAYAAKYGWHFEVGDGVVYGDGGAAFVYEVRPVTAFGFHKGEPYSQTRWRF